MNEAKGDYCVHRWDGGGPARVCLSCGQIRTFPDSPENPEVVWAGKGSEVNPLELPTRSKRIIAQVAKGNKIRKLEKLTGIPMHILRAWVGAYCRAPGKRGGPPLAIEKLEPQDPIEFARRQAQMTQAYVQALKELGVIKEPVAAPAVIDFTPPIVRHHGRHRIYQF